MAASDDSTLINSPQLDAHHLLQYGRPEPSRKTSYSSGSSSQAAMKRKRDSVTRPHAYSSSSRHTQVSTSTKTDNQKSNRDVRSLPRKSGQ